MNILSLLILSGTAGGLATDAVNSGAAAIAGNKYPMLFDIICNHFGLYNTSMGGVVFATCILLCMVSAYFIGSFNPAISFSRLIYHEDIRSHGSGNAGTTNTLRTYGKKMAVLIFVLDVVKAVIALLIGTFILSKSIGGAVSALFVVLGHMFPVYYKFKGGKGVACTAACILILSPVTFFILLALFVVIVAVFRYISLASIISAMLFPFLNHIFYPKNGWITLSALCIGALIIFMHRANIKRIMEGKESKLSFKSAKKKAIEDEEVNKVNKDANLVVDKHQEDEYSDDKFVKCVCGRTIPKSREKCVYCGEINKLYVPKAEDGDKKKR